MYQALFFFSFSSQRSKKKKKKDAWSQVTHMPAVAIQAPVVHNVENAIYQINLYSVDSAIGFPNTYLLNSDLSGWLQYLTFEQ